MIKENSIKIKGKKIDYKFRKRRGAKRLTLSVYSDATVSLTAPIFVSQRRAENFILEKSDWILAKIDYYAKIKLIKKYQTGKEDYFAKKQEALEKVMSIVSEVNKYYNFCFESVKIRNQKRRWGSCSSSGRLNFNYRIVYLDDDLARYIVAHELCHLKEMNHSKRFWNLLEEKMPEYKKQKQDLKIKGALLF